MKQFLIAFIIIMTAGAPGAHAVELAQIRDKKITAIQTPCLGAPVIAETSGAFQAAVDTTVSGAVQQAWLTRSNSPGAPVMLQLAAEPLPGGIAQYTLRPPAHTPAGLYDLHVRTADGSEDSQPHSVRLVADFKQDFRFTIIADIHFGDTRGQSLAPGRDFNALRRNIIKAACGSGAEFVLVAGDITNEPATYKSDYSQAWDYFTQYCNAPVFMVPGNHDSYGRRDSQGAYLDGKEYWKAYFGPLHQYFDYGDIRFIGLDNHDWPMPFRFNIKLLQAAESINRGNMQEDQFNWLTSVLAGAGSRRTYVFAHLPFDQMRGSQEFDNSMLPGIPKADVLDLLVQARVTHLFVGHWHRNEFRDVAGITQVMTNTAGSVLNDESQKWGFNTVHVIDREIQDIIFTEVDF